MSKQLGEWHLLWCWFSTTNWTFLPRERPIHIPLSIHERKEFLSLSWIDPSNAIQLIHSLEYFQGQQKSFDFMNSMNRMKIFGVSLFGKIWTNLSSVLLKNENMCMLSLKVHLKFDFTLSIHIDALVTLVHSNKG